MTGPEPLRVELEAFLAACQGQGANPVPAEAGVQALEIVEAAARAAVCSVRSRSPRSAKARRSRPSGGQ